MAPNHATFRAGRQAPLCSMCSKALSGHARPPHVPRSPGADRRRRKRHGRLPSLLPPARAPKQANTGMQWPRHLFTSSQRVDPPWAYRRRERAAAAGPSRLRASQPTPAQARARGASVGAPPGVSTMPAAWRGHTLCSASAFGKLAGTRRNSWSASKVRIIRPATGERHARRYVESPAYVMRRRKRHTSLQISDGQRATRRDLKLSRGRLPLLIGP